MIEMSLPTSQGHSENGINATDRSHQHGRIGHGANHAAAFDPDYGTNMKTGRSRR
jgi:hypothetical protein